MKQGFPRVRTLGYPDIPPGPSGLVFFIGVIIVPIHPHGALSPLCCSHPCPTQPCLADGLVHFNLTSKHTLKN